MDYKTLREQARPAFGRFCRVCPICDGRACAGEIPGAGGVGTGRSFQNNVKALAAIKLKQRIIHHVTAPDTSVTLFGQTLSVPVMGAPISGIAFNWNDFISEKEYAQAVVGGAAQAGTLGWIGDSKDPALYATGLEAVKENGGRGIPTIKPRENEAILALLARAAATGAPAAAIDIDAAALINMTAAGQAVSGKTAEELKMLCDKSPLPLIIKGVMTPEDAFVAAEAGAVGIVVSNHGGRVLDDTPGTAEVLPEIVQAVAGRLTVLVDGGVRTGWDVLKMLALGADGVLIGRPLLLGAVGHAEGVQIIMNKLHDELIAAMIMTGCASCRDAGAHLLA